MTAKRKLSETDLHYDLFFSDTVKDQLARVKKKNKMPCEQLRKRFEKLRNNPERNGFQVMTKSFIEKCM